MLSRPSMLPRTGGSYEYVPSGFLCTQPPYSRLSCTDFGLASFIAATAASSAVAYFLPALQDDDGEHAGVDPSPAAGSVVFFPLATVFPLLACEDVIEPGPRLLFQPLGSRLRAGDLIVLKSSRDPGVKRVIGAAMAESQFQHHDQRLVPNIAKAMPLGFLDSAHDQRLHTGFSHVLRLFRKDAVDLAKKPGTDIGGRERQLAPRQRRQLTQGPIHVCIVRSGDHVEVIVHPFVKIMSALHLSAGRSERSSQGRILRIGVEIAPAEERHFDVKANRTPVLEIVIIGALHGVPERRP